MFPSRNFPTSLYSPSLMLQATRLHNEGAPYGGTGFMDTTGSSSTNYGSSSQQARVVHLCPSCIASPLSLSLTQFTFIPRRDITRNQRPGSSFFSPFQANGPQVQSHIFRRSEPAAYPPHRAMRVAPGENPWGHQKPGMTVPSPRHWPHRQNRSVGPYVISLSLNYETRFVIYS